MVGRMQFLEVAMMKGVGYSLQICFRELHGQTVCDGPEDPLHNRYKFFCMICCVKVTMRARGAYEITRHYQSAKHLHQDQKYREKNFSRKSLREGRAKSVRRSVVGRVQHLYGLGSSRDGLQTTVILRCVRRQAILIYQCGRSRTDTNSTVDGISGRGGQLLLLDELWTQVYLLTGNFASTSDFNWIHGHISIRHFAVVVTLYMDDVVPLTVKD